MVRLIQFLLKLAAEEFYGEVRIRFQKGVPHGHMVEERLHLTADLPQPNPADPAYIKAVADVTKGVALSA